MSSRVSVDFFDPANDTSFNHALLDVVPVGVYKGGWLGGASGSVTVTQPCVVVMQVPGSDAPNPSQTGRDPNQVRIEFDSFEPLQVQVGPATPAVVVQWTDASGSAVTPVLTAIAVGSINPNQHLVLGVAVFSGSALVGWDYALRSEPDLSRLRLRVDAFGGAYPALVLVHGGVVQIADVTVALNDPNPLINGGNQRGEVASGVPGAVAYTMTLPGSGTVVALLYVDSLGRLHDDVRGVGAPNYDNIASSSYGKNGWVVLAEVSMNTGGITAIRDVRGPSMRPVVVDGTTVTGDGTAAHPLVAPAQSPFPGNGISGQTTVLTRNGTYCMVVERGIITGYTFIGSSAGCGITLGGL